MYRAELDTQHEPQRRWTEKRAINTRMHLSFIIADTDWNQQICDQQCPHIRQISRRLFHAKSAFKHVPSTLLYCSVLEARVSMIGIIRHIFEKCSFVVLG